MVFIDLKQCPGHIGFYMKSIPNGNRIKTQYFSNFLVYIKISTEISNLNLQRKDYSYEEDVKN